MDRVLDHVAREDAEAVIAVPEWTSRAFWCRTESAARRRRVDLDFTLEVSGSIKANHENEEHFFFLGGALFNSRMRMMRTTKLDHLRTPSRASL